MAKADFVGVHSTRGAADPTSGNAGGRNKQFWFVWYDASARTYLAQPLTPDCKPAGRPGLLSPEGFRQSFVREPRIDARPDIRPDVADYLNTAPRPQKRQSDATLITGPIRDITARKAESQTPRDVPPAPPEKSGKTGMPEELDRALRADFAMAIMRFRRGSRDSAMAEFQRLASTTDGIVAAHKHMFTDFGKDLRQCKLPDLALICYSRAVDLSPDDSHACFNLARLYYEMGRHGEAREYLEKALELEPGLDCAQKLREKIRNQ